MDLRVIFYDFSQQASTFVRSSAVCSATFRRDLLLHLLNPYHTISAVTALQAAAQLEVECLVIRVLRDEHLDIHQPVHFASPAAAGIVCYTAIRLAATSQPNVYWLEEVMRPVAQRLASGRPPLAPSRPSRPPRRRSA